MSLPPGRRVTRVELLRAETDIPFTGGADAIEFTIPRVLDYEVRRAVFRMRGLVTALPTRQKMRSFCISAPTRGP